jgi:hypothetical protein
MGRALRLRELLTHVVSERSDVERRIYNAAGPDEICIVSRVNYYHPVNLSCLAHLTHPRTFHLHSPLLPVLFLETRELLSYRGAAASFQPIFSWYIALVSPRVIRKVNQRVNHCH